jgi:ATP-dependent DNA helicase RecG
LALALFDGWSYAVINHSPVHKEIRSKVVDADDGRDEVTQMIKGHLMAGRKVIFLYPVVSEKKAGSVQDRAKAMEARFPSMVAALHGKLKPEQKIQALEDFRSSKCPIIVASTAIEVGVDVPDVGMMVVSGADRFGASQLHQLRGRLVRNGGLGDFVMLAPKTMAKDTRARLQALVDYADGFALAEKDLALRGFGELLGEMQKGGKGATLLKLSRLEPEDFLAS